ncbi:MAG: flavin reductase family protein [Sedimentitalea sp.]
MFYRPEDGHGLPHYPFYGFGAPRALHSFPTRRSAGLQRLAPYSFFNAIAYVPPQVMFSSTGEKPDQDRTKDSVANILETEVFCVNIVEYGARDAMNDSSGDWDKDVDEFAKAGLERIECETINCARVANAPAALECKLTQVITLPGAVNKLVLGEVTGVHIRDNCLRDGRFDVTTFQPLARLGYRDYTRVTDLFELTRPGEK